MPNNPRQQIKKDIERAVNHVKWIQEILINTGEKYRADHPEIAKEYETTYAFFEQGKEILQAFRNAY